MSETHTDAWFAPGDLAELGPRVRERALSSADCDALVAEGYRVARLAPGREGHLRALVLLWNDHLEEAHGLVQDLPDRDAAFIHGVMHRREPDYANARYWFLRAGGHAVLEPLADVVAPLLASKPALPYRLIREGRWDPFAFIDAVSASCRAGEGSAEAGLLRELQRCESMVLARHLAGV